MYGLMLLLPLFHECFPGGDGEWLSDARVPLWMLQKMALYVKGCRNHLITIRQVTGRLWQGSSKLFRAIHKCLVSAKKRLAKAKVPLLLERELNTICLPGLFSRQFSFSKLGPNSAWILVKAFVLSRKVKKCRSDFRVIACMVDCIQRYDQLMPQKCPSPRICADGDDGLESAGRITRAHQQRSEERRRRRRSRTDAALYSRARTSSPAPSVPPPYGPFLPLSAGHLSRSVHRLLMPMFCGQVHSGTMLLFHSIESNSSWEMHPQFADPQVQLDDVMTTLRIGPGDAAAAAEAATNALAATNPTAATAANSGGALTESACLKCSPGLARHACRAQHVVSRTSLEQRPAMTASRRKDSDFKHFLEVPELKECPKVKQARKLAAAARLPEQNERWSNRYRLMKAQQAVPGSVVRPRLQPQGGLQLMRRS